MSDRYKLAQESTALSEMLEAQRELQRGYTGDPSLFEGPERRLFVKDMVIAINAELIEFLDEADWKPWTSRKEFNDEAMQSELVDVWHFFMNLMMASHMNMEDLYTKYFAKRDVNKSRQANNYDGKSTKCIGCGRALDDDAVKCRVPTDAEVNLLGVCEWNGAIFKADLFDSDDRSAAGDGGWSTKITSVDDTSDNQRQIDAQFERKM